MQPVNQYSDIYSRASGHAQQLCPECRHCPSRHEIFRQSKRQGPQDCQKARRQASAAVCLVSTGSPFLPSGTLPILRCSGVLLPMSFSIAWDRDERLKVDVDANYFVGVQSPETRTDKSTPIATLCGKMPVARNVCH